MTAVAKELDAPNVAPDLIREHVRMIQHLAEPFRDKGKIVIACFGEAPDQLDPKTKKPGRSLQPQVFHVDVGDVDHAAAGIAGVTTQPHCNVYMPLAIFRPDLPAGGKGSERDIVACLGLIADFDDPDAARWAERRPIPPNYVLETSAGRFQAFYLFDKPEFLEAAKPVAERLKAFARCDHGTSDISHVWRVAGTLNWPNAKKVGEGRSREPQIVLVAQVWDGTTISLQALDAALPTTKPNVNAQQGAKSGDQNSAQRSKGRRSGQPHAAAVRSADDGLSPRPRRRSPPRGRSRGS